MLQLNSVNELSKQDVWGERKHEPGMEIAVLRRTHPLLLVNTIDTRVEQWNCQWSNLHVMSLNSARAPAPIDFSVLAVIVVFWESALRGAKYSCVSDFFDFLDLNTRKWLEAVIATKTDHIFVFLKGKLINTSIVQALDKDLAKYYQFCLDTGINAVRTIPYFRLITSDHRSIYNRDKDSSIRDEHFKKVKEFLFLQWPDDPFKAFIAAKSK